MKNNSCVNIVIPMAGEGKRFIDVGNTTPKPLIRVLDKTLVQWALESFYFLDQLPNYRLIFIVLNKHINSHSVDKVLEAMFGKVKTVVIGLEHSTGGQAETVLAAEKYINNDDKLFIYNCDTYSTAPIWKSILKYDPDGMLSCFVSDDPSLSYVKEDIEGNVVDVKEKEVISNLATTGMYYFKKGKDFVKVAKGRVSEAVPQTGEYYVAPCYNDLIKKGACIKTVMAEECWVLGTPAQLHYFETHYHENID